MPREESPGGAAEVSDGFAATDVADPERRDSAPASDPMADTAAELGGPRHPTPDPRHDRLLRASVKSKLFVGSPADEAPTIGRYAVLKVLGEGGMGTVYACFDDQLDRRVALKLVKGAESQDARKRMLREAQAMAKLSHPNVVPVFEVGEHDGQLFVAMEYIRGVTLKLWQTEEERPWREVLSKYLQAGRGLAAAHAEGLVHRDFKPDNAVVGTDGRVRVLDFGLAAKRGAQEVTGTHVTIMPVAKDAALDTPLTVTGTVMGTPAYMPPEQFMSGTVDARSDQFSFCVSLWEGLYGARPFAGSTAAELFTKVAQGNVTGPGHSDAPAALRDALQQGLAAEPDQRWPDLAALLAELGRLDVDPARARRTRRTLVGLAVGAVALVGSVLVAQQQLDAHRARRCGAAAAEQVAASWNDDTRASVRSGLLATNLVYSEATADRVLPLLDAYASDWRGVAETACLDSSAGRMAPSDLRRTQWCLDQHTVTLSALTARLAEADPDAVSAAVTEASTLEPLQACGDLDLLRRLPDPPGDDEREAVADVLASLEDAAAQADAKKFGSAVPLAEGALQAAHALDRPSLVAQAAATLGSIYVDTGDVAKAEPELEKAFFAARVAGDPIAEDRIATQLAYVVGYRNGRPEEGLRWSRHAEVARQALGSGDQRLLEVDAKLAHAAILIGHNDTVGARALLNDVLAAQQVLLGAAHPSIADTISSIGQSYLFQDDPVTARTFIRQAIDIREQALGERHPDVASDYAALGATHMVAAEFAEARDFLERALAMRRAALPPGHHRIAEAEDELANVLSGLGEDDAAQTLYESSLQAKTAQFGGDATDLLVTLINLGDLHRRRGQLQEAKTAFEHFAAIGRKHGRASAEAVGLSRLGGVYVALGNDEVARTTYEKAIALGDSDSPGRGPDIRPLVELAKLHARQQDLDEAAAMALRAVALLDRVPVPDRPRFQFAVAKLLAAREPGQARALANDALAGWSTPPFDSKERVSAVEAWLRAHESPEAP